MTDKGPKAQTKHKVLITPSKDAIKRFVQKVREEWMTLKGAPPAGIIKHLNPIIRGWANYYRTVVSKRVFQKLDHWLHRR